jgi:acyl carrier protein
MTSTTDTETRLAVLWRDVLGIDDITSDDDFFELGGNSLGAIRLTFRIRETFGTEITLREFYAAPTLADCARTIDHNAAEATAAPTPTIHRIDRSQPTAGAGGGGGEA